MVRRIVKAKINDDIIECLSEVCNKDSCPNYDTCNSYLINISSVTRGSEEYLKELLEVYRGNK